MQNTDLLDDFDFGDHDRQQYFQPDDDGMVVAKFYSQMEANVSAARLRSEGIPCFITNAFSQSMLPETQSFVSLHVRSEDIERAKEILAENAVSPDLTPTSFGFENTLLIFLVVVIVFVALAAYLNF